jgi:hypothetical protein
MIFIQHPFRVPIGGAAGPVTLKSRPISGAIGDERFPVVCASFFWVDRIPFVCGQRPEPQPIERRLNFRCRRTPETVPNSETDVATDQSM